MPQKPSPKAGSLRGEAIDGGTMILAIDPGPTKSAFFAMNATGVTIAFGIKANHDLLDSIWENCTPDDIVVIEKIASMGMAVGEEVFETVFWSGRFAEACLHRGCDVVRITRAKVKMAICGNMRAKDANIRQALIDRYGGSDAIKKGGKLHGVSKDVWAALAVGHTYLDQTIGRES